MSLFILIIYNHIIDTRDYKSIMLSRFELRHMNVLKDSIYNDVRYIITRNWFGGFCVYIDVEEWPWFDDERWQNMLPFHGGCTYAGGLEDIVGDHHFFLGADYCHGNDDICGIEFGYKLSTIESDIKEVIDTIPTVIMRHDIELGG